MVYHNNSIFRIRKTVSCFNFWLICRFNPYFLRACSNAESKTMNYTFFNIIEILRLDSNIELKSSNNTFLSEEKPSHPTHFVNKNVLRVDLISQVSVTSKFSILMILKKSKIKIIFRRYLNRYYSMFFSQRYYLVSIIFAISPVQLTIFITDAKV